MSRLGVHSSGRLTLQYHQYGEGAINVIALHGFGQNGGVFRGLGGDREEEITVYAFDLFFHGSSNSKNLGLKVRQSLTNSEWQDFFQSFLNERRIIEFSLVTYSMGARLGMSLLESFSKRLNCFVLVAPDGFIDNHWYRFAVDTYLGQSIFKRLPKYNRYIPRLAIFLKKMNLLDKKMYQVAVENTSSKEKCLQLYNTWTFLKKIRPDIELVSRELEMKSIKVEVHLGKFDKLIPPSKILKWSYLAANPDNALVHDLGHNLLRSAVFKCIKFS
ncbi:MAG: alpha/beta hydrolase [Flavobacteriales bacterium]|nr:alpha/beta hydrolase [Flavobacteriales bacterium]